MTLGNRNTGRKREQWLLGVVSKEVAQGTVGVDIQFYEYVKPHRTVHHKGNFMVCK